MDTHIVTSNAVCKRRHGCVGVVSLDVPCKTDVQDAVMEEFEEFDEDGLVDSDDDDNSWKVRRAALKAGTAGTAGPWPRRCLNGWAGKARDSKI